MLFVNKVDRAQAVAEVDEGVLACWAAVHVNPVIASPVTLSAKPALCDRAKTGKSAFREQCANYPSAQGSIHAGWALGVFRLC